MGEWERAELECELGEKGSHALYNGGPSENVPCSTPRSMSLSIEAHCEPIRFVREARISIRWINGDGTASPPAGRNARGSLIKAGTLRRGGK